jgi:hypothetical protein
MNLNEFDLVPIVKKLTIVLNWQCRKLENMIDDKENHPYTNESLNSIRRTLHQIVRYLHELQAGRVPDIKQKYSDSLIIDEDIL